MDQRISIVTIGVKHLETSKKFYVDGLGWKPVFENKEIVFLKPAEWCLRCFYANNSLRISKPIRLHSDEQPWPWRTTFEKRARWNP